MMIFGTLLAVAGMAHAQDTVGTAEFDPLGEHLDLPKVVRVIVEFFEVSQEYATELVARERESTNDSDLRAEVVEMIKKKEDARAIDTASVTTRSGQRAKVESIKEVIYPTEYEPPIAEGVKGMDGEKKEKIAPPTPTAFEMRPVGTTLEVDPIVGLDGVTVELNIAPEIVYQNEDRVFAVWKSKEVESIISMPEFYTLKMSTSITMLSGQTQLAGILAPQDDLHKVLVFVKAGILSVGK